MRFALVAATCSAFLMTLPVQAATFKVHLEGTITAQTNPGVDPRNITVGDKITLDAVFSKPYYKFAKPLGYYVAGFQYRTFGPSGPIDHSLGTSGPEYFRIGLRGFTWAAGDHLNDLNFPFFTSDYGYTLSLAGMAFSDNKVLGVAGALWPQVDRPVFDLGSVLPLGAAGWNGPEVGDQPFEFWDGGFFSPNFELSSADGAYNNNYKTPGFTGVWDFANSTVSVPETANWIMMIAGFGMIGSTMRVRPRSSSLSRI